MGTAPGHFWGPLNQGLCDLLYALGPVHTYVILDTPQPSPASF